MTPRLNHVKSSDIPAVVEMPTTSSLKQIATMSVEKVKGFSFVFCQSQAGKAIHIPVTSVHSVLLLTLACYRGMLFVFWTQCFQRQGKLKYDAKSFWQDQCDVRCSYTIFE